MKQNNLDTYKEGINECPNEISTAMIEDCVDNTKK